MYVWVLKKDHYLLSGSRRKHLLIGRYFHPVHCGRDLAVILDKSQLKPLNIQAKSWCSSNTIVQCCDVPIQIHRHILCFILKYVTRVIEGNDTAEKALLVIELA